MLDVYTACKEHLEEHEYEACRSMSCAERIFFRKDHLVQHLRLTHGVKFSPWMNSWKRVRDDIKSRCGFCNVTMSSWKERTSHLAYHYKAGASMSDWVGGWGFEPDVERLVENAKRPEQRTQTMLRPSYLDSCAGIQPANALRQQVSSTAKGPDP
ncbi:hypothetical protein KEM52_001764 [Ascosphaera acerosa]|nr:hypothetical protein KEM52_001764 [Ascosphaera acerosa]